MRSIRQRRHCFSPEIIQHAVWLDFRFPLSYRIVENLLAEHGIPPAHVKPYAACKSSQL